MENITIGQIGTLIGFLVALIGGVEFLAMRMRKYIKSTMEDEIKPIKENQVKHDERLNQLELSSDKNFIVRFLADIEQNNPIDEVEKERFYEIYQRYRELGGNSYVAHKVEKLQKEGKL